MRLNVVSLMYKFRRTVVLLLAFFFSILLLSTTYICFVIVFDLRCELRNG